MKRILLVEGNKNIRRFIRRELGKSGHVVMETADGDEAIQLLDRDKPDVLIVDIHTKKKKSLESFRCRATSKGRLPVIILTSKTPYETDVSNWNPVVILERSTSAPELQQAVEKSRPAGSQRRSEEPASQDVSSR